MNFRTKNNAFSCGTHLITLFIPLEQIFPFSLINDHPSQSTPGTIPQNLAEFCLIHHSLPDMITVTGLPGGFLVSGLNL